MFEIFSAYTEKKKRAKIHGSPTRFIWWSATQLSMYGASIWCQQKRAHFENSTPPKATPSYIFVSHKNPGRFLAIFQEKKTTILIFFLALQGLRS